jgi:hypothetical protein
MSGLLLILIYLSQFREFISEWLKYPEVMLRFQNDLQGRLFRSYDEKRIERLSLAERIAHLLIYLSNHKTVVKGVITVPITRREIAAYGGAVKEYEEDTEALALYRDSSGIKTIKLI